MKRRVKGVGRNSHSAPAVNLAVSQGLADAVDELDENADRRSR